MHVNDLPPEILENILSYLTVKEKFQCERVCRLWQRLLFVSVRTLAFEGFDDEFYGTHEHVVSKENYLPSEVNWDENAVKIIILKCGKYLHSFKGFVSLATMRIIAHCCEQLHCADMLFNDNESLKILADRFCTQLTCATLYANFMSDITPFLVACSKLTSVAVVKPRRIRPFVSGRLIYLLDLFYCKMETPPVATFFESVRKLVIKGNILETTLNRLPMFTNLEMIDIELTSYLYEMTKWRDVMSAWSGLRSLSVKVYCENYKHCKIIPPNLENFSLKIQSEYVLKEPIMFTMPFPKLKTLQIFQRIMNPGHLNPLLKSVVLFCPLLEELSLGYYLEEFDRFQIPIWMDEYLETLLSLSSLTKLILGNEFRISDNFATKLLTDLKKLTSIGSRDANLCCKNWLPGGPSFWQTLRQKAVSRPHKSFYLVGMVDVPLHLNAPLPSNVSLCLTNIGKLSLSNGFGTSVQWKELVAQWCELTHLTIQIKGTDLLLNGVPKSVNTLTINCSNKVECGERNTFTLCTTLSNLNNLNISQEFMNNQHLGITIKSICKCCPKLKKLSVMRRNLDHEPVDEQLMDLLNCQFLERVCLTEKFKISDVFSSRLTDEVKTLHSLTILSTK